MKANEYCITAEKKKSFVFPSFVVGFFSSRSAVI